MHPLPTPALRPYRSPTDAAATFEVFQAAIRRTAATVYDADQVEAWAGSRDVDLTAWDERRRTAFTVVAECDDPLVGSAGVVGFADLLPDGVVDMLFVHPDAGGRGVARSLVAAVRAEGTARGLTELRTFASRSAQPAFERFGFELVADRPGNLARGVVVPNAELRCRL
ncbi:GNAT family N-acetyltransferase [Cellulomonas sp. HZM]|uniref:GNAT family N-acetyltransferase n=1 Tax=Cellulomonas sp. HZM TaxID=1454010 RepID=UPI000A512BBC|nr:GNAT family N-acetyltransferase [Cellulomonas sp. HZM]